MELRPAMDYLQSIAGLRAWGPTTKQIFATAMAIARDHGEQPRLIARYTDMSGVPRNVIGADPRVCLFQTPGQAGQPSELRLVGRAWSVERLILVDDGRTTDAWAITYERAPVVIYITGPSTWGAELSAHLSPINMSRPVEMVS